MMSNRPTHKYSDQFGKVNIAINFDITASRIYVEHNIGRVPDWEVLNTVWPIPKQNGRSFFDLANPLHILLISLNHLLGLMSDYKSFYNNSAHINPLCTNIPFIWKSVAVFIIEIIVLEIIVHCIYNMTCFYVIIRLKISIMDVS